MKELLENFFTSCYDFSESEYELKSKYALVNGMLGITILFVFVLTIFLVFYQKYLFALATSTYLLLQIGAIFFLRKSKTNYRIVIPLIPTISILLILIALNMYPLEHVRLLWFFVAIIASFFLGGRRLGFFVTFLSVFSIVFANYYFNMNFNSYTLVLANVIILLGAAILNLYENREEVSKKRLSDMNISLELRVKDEIKKRILMYEESNNKLKKSALELEKQKNSYRELAFYDTLTGLPNRALFYDRLRHSIHKAKRHHTKVAVLFLDLDNFKEINDSLGHYLGDKVLKAVASRLKNKIRKSDSLARIGGDEFTLLLEDFRDVSVVGDIAKNLIDVILEPIYIDNHQLYVSVSIGIGIYPDDGTDASALLKYADAAMYSAKKEGFGLFHFYKKEMTEKSLERLTLETSIRQGLENNEFVVYYQPVMSSSKNKLIGLEALVRWQHPQRGLLAPVHFMEVAESSALIVQLGEYVLRSAAKQFALWYSQELHPDFLAVNLSVKQLHHHTLMPLLSEILESTSFCTSWLELEITEGYTMQKPKEAIKFLKQIRRLGIRLSIDDFGTGFSSLSYLKKLPVNKLKIDRSFIKDIPRHKGDMALVSAIVSMSKSMHLEVVAEGVETQEQRDFLDSIGCDKIQGYYFSKPISANDIEMKYLKK